MTNELKDLIRKKGNVSLTTLLQDFPESERGIKELQIQKLAQSGDIDMQKKGNDYELSVNDDLVKETIPEEHPSSIQSQTHYLLLRHNRPQDSENPVYDDVLGKIYHYRSSVRNYNKIVSGTKTIWFDTKDGSIKLWGYGTVSNVEESNGDFKAKFNDFKQFDKTTKIKPGLELSDPVSTKIQELPTWNPSNSILQITKDIYDEITLSNQIKSSDNVQSNELFADEQLPVLNDSDLKNGLAEINENLLVPDKKILEIITALASGNHVILSGPIGTGKTELAKKIPLEFWKKHGGYFPNVYTATADWNTQDVIGGIVPKMNGDKVHYGIQDGCITESVKMNWHENMRRHFSHDGENYRGVWAIVDEFNRADIDKAFGQLFTALRTGEMKVPTNSFNLSHDKIKIPKDFRIIGTINTADKHYLFPLSDALKSRFSIIEIEIPDPKYRDKEIYYSLKAAINSLDYDFSQIVILDDDNKKLDGINNESLYAAIYGAYNFLAFVRLFKRLGTAMLKIIFQHLLVGFTLKQNINEVLDNSINSTIIPQLEGLSEFSLGAIDSVFSDKLIDYFRELNKTNKRISSDKAFRKTIAFFNIPDTFEEFNQKKLPDDAWKKIQDAYNNRMQSKETSLPLTLRSSVISIRNLAENAVI